MPGCLIIVPHLFAHLAPDVKAGNCNGPQQEHHDQPAAAGFIVALHLTPFSVHFGVDVIRQGHKDFRLIHHFIAGVSDRAVLQIIVQPLPHFGDGGGVADEVTILVADIRFTHKVDEHFGGFLMFAGSRDA